MAPALIDAVFRWILSIAKSIRPEAAAGIAGLRSRGVKHVLIFHRRSAEKLVMATGMLVPGLSAPVATLNVFHVVKQHEKQLQAISSGNTCPSPGRSRAGNEGEPESARRQSTVIPRTPGGKPGSV